MTPIEELKVAMFDLKMAFVSAVCPFIAPMAYSLTILWLGFVIWKVVA